MDPFEYDNYPSRVIFGRGNLLKLPAEVTRLGSSRPLLLSTPQQAGEIERLKAILQSPVAGVFTEATMHTPLSVTMKALELAKATNADCVISIGGGSTIGLGKAICVRTDLPHICIPTTYAGSEMTPVLGETADGQKRTRSDPKIRPGTVIYDPDLTLSLPASISATSGVNAMAHAIEALYSTKKNPIISLLALEGIRALAESLPTIVKNTSNVDARSKDLYGAWLCGVCLGAVGMALHHKLCHTVGGTFNMPHAETHTIILPHALSYNAPKIPRVLEQLAEVLPRSNGDAIKGLDEFLNELGVARALTVFGFNAQDIDKAAELAVANPYPNPRIIELNPVRELIKRAVLGERPQANF